MSFRRGQNIQSCEIVCTLNESSSLLQQKKKKKKWQKPLNNYVKRVIALPYVCIIREEYICNLRLRRTHEIPQYACASRKGNPSSVLRSDEWQSPLTSTKQSRCKLKDEEFNYFSFRSCFNNKIEYLPFLFGAVSLT